MLRGSAGTVDIAVTVWAAKPLDVGDRNDFDADFAEGSQYLFKFERLDDRFDFFHSGFPNATDCLSRGTNVVSAEVSGARPSRTPQGGPIVSFVRPIFQAGHFWGGL